MHIEFVNEKCANNFCTITVKQKTINGTIETINRIVGLTDTIAEDRPRDPRPRRSKKRSYHASIQPNTCLIAIGDYGFKDRSAETISKRLNELNRALSEMNIFIYLVRNCDDNPLLFNENKINLSNIKLLPDVTLLCSKKMGNVLCIGGGVSYNKKWKNSFFNTTKKQLFFENEMTALNYEELDDVISKNEINFVVSSSCPSFCEPMTLKNPEIKKWGLGDGDKEYFRKERSIIDMVYIKLLEQNSIPTMWSYGLSALMGECANSLYGEIMFVSSSDVINLSQPHAEDLSYASMKDLLNGFSASSLKVNGLNTYNYRAVMDAPNAPIDGHVLIGDEIDDIEIPQGNEVAIDDAFFMPGQNLRVVVDEGNDLNF